MKILLFLALSLFAIALPLRQSWSYDCDLYKSSGGDAASAKAGYDFAMQGCQRDYISLFGGVISSNAKPLSSCIQSAYAGIFRQSSDKEGIGRAKGRINIIFNQLVSDKIKWSAARNGFDLAADSIPVKSSGPDYIGYENCNVNLFKQSSDLYKQYPVEMGQMISEMEELGVRADRTKMPLSQFNAQESDILLKYKKMVAGVERERQMDQVRQERDQQELELMKAQTEALKAQKDALDDIRRQNSQSRTTNCTPTYDGYRCTTY